jgi:hypothetical protein
MADPVDAKLADVLDAVVLRLRTAVVLNERTCFLYIRRPGMPPPAAPDDIFLTVEPDGGQFDAGLLVGGDREQATVKTGVAITIHSNVMLDAAMHDARVLSDSARGMLIFLDRILDALVGHNLLLASGNPCLRELMVPQGWNKPDRPDPTDKRAELTVVFALEFDWNLP